MNEQRIFEEFSFSLKSQLNQFTYWFTELTPVQQMVCFNLSMNIVNDASLLMSGNSFKHILNEKAETIANANSLHIVKELNFTKFNLIEMASWLKVYMPCLSSSRCTDDFKELHMYYVSHVKTFFSLLTTNLITKEQYSLLDSDEFLQDVEAVLGIFLLHPDFRLEEKQTISEHIMNMIKTIDPQGNPRLQEVERFFIYLMSLHEEIMIFTSCLTTSKVGNYPGSGHDMSRFIKDFLHLPKTHNSGYSSLRSSGFISECENSSSQASIPGNFVKHFPFRRESDDRYSYLIPGSYTQRILPSRRQSASPFFIPANGTSSTSTKNCGGPFNNNKMNSVYNFSDLNSQAGHLNGGGTSGHRNGLEIHREYHHHPQQHQGIDGKRITNPHIEIHVLPEASCHNVQQHTLVSETLESLDSELNTNVMFNSQCYLQPNSPLGGLSRASSGSFQSSELNSSDSPYFMSIFDHGNFSPNTHNQSLNINNPIANGGSHIGNSSISLHGKKSPYEVDAGSSSLSSLHNISHQQVKRNCSINGKHYNSNGPHHLPGMQNILMWLKNLRLHKYTEIFKDITYDELMNMNDIWLDEHNVTQGAKNKILINIAKLHDRATLLEVMKTKLTTLKQSQHLSISNCLVSLKGCLSDLRQILLSPIYPVSTGSGISNNINGSVVVSQMTPQPLVDYKMEDLPSAIVEVLVKLTEFCCHLDSVDYDSQARLLEIYNLISENEAFTQSQKETISNCQSRALSVHAIDIHLNQRSCCQTTSSSSPRNINQINGPGGGRSPRDDYIGPSSSGLLTLAYDSCNNKDSPCDSYYNSNSKKIIERTFSEPYRGNPCENLENSSSGCFLLTSHDTMDCGTAKASAILYNTSNMSLACSDNFSDNTISHIGVNNSHFTKMSQGNGSQSEACDSNGVINGLQNDSSTAMINRNLDQLTRKVTQLAIQESDQSE